MKRAREWSRRAGFLFHPSLLETQWAKVRATQRVAEGRRAGPGRAAQEPAERLRTRAGAPLLLGRLHGDEAGGLGVPGART